MSRLGAGGTIPVTQNYTALQFVLGKSMAAASGEVANNKEQQQLKTLPDSAIHLQFTT
jgi:hypothetical protein